MIVSVVVSMLLFAGAAYLGIEAGAWFGGRTVAEESRTPRPPIAQVPIIAATAIVGGILTAREIAVPQIILTGFICASLCGAWWSDINFRFVPDALIVVPLAVVLAVAGSQREWGVFEAAAISAVPFGVVALASRGRGIARADALVAALGGAVLGIQLAIIGFAVACFALFGVNAMTKRQGTLVAATPYMAASIVGCILFRVLRV